ncbi:hypothetical protein [Clostridium coskatii]|uniref:Uncharacterized protein n=1 Tax=Clostridium coskatii TaxID=1705578 RepID=A0A168NEV9_9CLOT|nr:hypothetical protein [Clostridium coskatii]OAA86337.1 hypothetical protein WX73_02831 [Clostridium coskatii]OAA86355.1 hypothetical protein WX73_02849 [Clostridium coskatii]OBR95078.1 hypothetical protein CLCOS_17830 [Clostridium coskatii]
MIKDVLKKRLKADGYKYIYAIYGINLKINPYKLNLTYVIYSNLKINPYDVLLTNCVKPYAWGMENKKVDDFINFHTVEINSMDEEELCEFVKQKNTKEYEIFYCNFEKKFHKKNVKINKINLKKIL